MNVLESVKATADNYPGGIDKLASLMGIARKILDNKLDPQILTHHLTLNETMRLMKITGDHRIFYAMAEELGYLVEVTESGYYDVRPKPSLSMMDANLNSESLKVITSFGEFITLTSKTLGNSKITKLNIIDIGKAQTNMQQQLAYLSLCMEAKSVT
jgi:hypothetical protein